VISHAREVVIKESKFFNNSAEHFGGSICIIDVDELIISRSEFYNNSAKFGSAIAMHSVRDAVFSSNKFESNSASAAGTVFWIYDDTLMPKLPLIPLSDNVFLKNTAGLYGPHIASSFFRIKSDVNTIQITDYTSGSYPVKITQSSVDAYDQIIPYGNGTSFLAKSPDKSNKLPFDCGGDSARGALFGTLKEYLSNGVAHFRTLGATCFPGGYMVLKFFILAAKKKISTYKVISLKLHIL